MTTITPLGTISPYCKYERNCPGFMIEEDKKRALLDCGNGITRYLDIPKDLEDLIVIISHLHKDHYGDLSALAYASYVNKNLGYLQERIKVYIPEGDQIDATEDYKDDDGWACSRKVKRNLPDFDYLMNFGQEHFLEFIPYKEKDELEHGNIKISFKRNPHQLVTYSIKLETQDGKIVYSSDTGYKNNTLANFSKNADILICESSFIKGQHRSTDNHLYACETAQIAKEAEVKQLLLTHLYPEVDRNLYLQEAKEVFENTHLAEENKKLVLRRNI